MNITFRRRLFIPVSTPSVIKVECNIKVENGVMEEAAWIAIMGWDTAGREVRGTWFTTPPLVSRDWVRVEASKEMPGEVAYVEIRMVCAGSGKKGELASTWFDDLKIYQDGVLIYANDFNNWNPYIGAGLGAVLTGILTQLITGKIEYSVGAGLLGGLGGGVAGYYFGRQI